MRVVVVAGPDAPREAAFVTSRIVVGRAEGVDLALSDPTVSQFHVALAPGADGVGLEDLGSHNGTRAGEVVVARGRVPFGAEIALGGTRLRLDRAEDFVAERSRATSFGGLVGASPAMRELYAVLERLARTDIPVLLEGPAGTGKSLGARALHDAGPRASGPFVVLDCGAIPLLAFDPAALVGDARGGTLVLEDVGDLPPDLQTKLARALTDVRTIATTARDLYALVNRGAFREELHRKVAQARVRMPTLAERAEDIKPLVQHFLGALPWNVRCARAIAPEALDAVAARGYPGDVGELRRAVERLAMLAEGPSISLDDLAFDRLVGGGRHAARAPEDDATIEPFKEAKRSLVDEFEKNYLTRLLARSGMNISRAAALAGIERQSIRDLLKKHGLRGEDRE